MDDAREEYPPHALRDYALLADGERAVVVGPRGEHCWMCFPGWSDPSIFGNLVGAPGIYAVTPLDEAFVWGGSYEDAGLIWRARWVTTSSVVECREALARPARTDRAVILREVVGVHGVTRLRVVLDARAEFGNAGLDDLRHTDTVWEARTGGHRVRLSGLADARVEDGALVGEIEVGPGDHQALTLEIGGDDDEPIDPVTAWRDTELAWKESLPDTGDLWAPRDVRHGFAVLRGLTSSRGGMVAAATTSLPERAEGGRNYDYRYVWIRDQAMVAQAIAKVGPHPLLDEAVGFVADRILEDGEKLRPAYAVGGGTIPDERALDLPGYPGGTDNIGNHAGQQFQLDVFGESLLLFAAAAGYDGLDDRARSAVRAAVAAIMARSGEADAGIWELEPRRWAHSRLICAAGLQAIAEHAPVNEAEKWVAFAHRLLVSVDGDCRHADGHWQRAPRDEHTDASLLIPVIRRVVAPDDPRALATVRAVRRELGDDHQMFRFRHGPGPLAEREGAFLLSGFHMAIACGQQGDPVEAARWFERNRSACGPPGLFTEEFDPLQRQLRGNIPQAFVHGALIEASAELSRATS